MVTMRLSSAECARKVAKHKNLSTFSSRTRVRKELSKCLARQFAQLFSLVYGAILVRNSSREAVKKEKKYQNELLTICMRNNNLLRSAKYEAFARAKFFNQHEEKNW